MRRNAGLKLVIILFVFSTGIYAGHGLSNEIFLAKQWRDLETPRSVLVNPSFAAYCDWITVSSALSVTQLNRFFLTNLQGIVPLSSFAFKSHTIGVGYVGYASGKFDRTVWSGNRIVKVEDGSQYSEHYGTLTYAFRPFDFLAIGTNVNIVSQTNFDNPVIDGSFDLGVSYSLRTTRFGNYLFGLCFLNPARISRFEIPVYTPDVGMSVGFEKEIKGITFDGGIECNYRAFWGNNFSSPRFDVTGRLGAKINSFLQLYVQGGRDYGGFSVKFELDSSSKKLPKTIPATSAAMQVLFTKAQVAPTNTVYLSAQLGKNRNVMTGEANDIYQRAQNKMAQGEYWEAYAYFSLLENEYPNFSKNDEVRVRSAFCLEKLFMFDKSSEKYQQTKKMFKDDNFEDKNKIIGAADLGLLRIFRNFADSQTVLDQFNQLQKSTNNDSLQEHGWYELGQFYMNKGEWFHALDAFKKIDQNHYDYPFAQYSTGICHVMTDAASKEIKRSFNEAIAFDAKTSDQWEINFKAKYALGCFYYEEGAFANAQRFLQQIPDSSDIYYDALVVIGWAMFRSQLWGKCRQVAEIMQDCNIPDVQAEGFVLEQYALLKDTTMQETRQKRLSHSLQQADKANQLIPTIKYILTIDKSIIDHENDSIAKEVWALIEKYHQDLQNGKERQFILKSIEDLRTPVETRKQKIADNKYNLDLARHYSSIEGRINALIDDVEYLRAKLKLLHDREVQNPSGSMPKEVAPKDNNSNISTPPPSPAPTEDSKEEQSLIEQQKREIELLKMELEKAKKKSVDGVKQNSEGAQ